jgi:hypothetical protein
MTLMAAKLMLVANLSCLVMIAPPLYRTVGFHSVSVRRRPGGRQIVVRLLRQLLIF